jgi:hypothetical protein
MSGTGVMNGNAKSRLSSGVVDMKEKRTRSAREGCLGKETPGYETTQLRPRPPVVEEDHRNHPARQQRDEVDALEKPRNQHGKRNDKPQYTLARQMAQAG